MADSRGSVLLIEDNPDDVLLTRRAFRKAGIVAPLEVCTDGEQGIDYLAGQGDFTDRERHAMPGLVLLDWKLPRRSGLELLQWVRKQQGFASLPVVVLSSSRLQVDIDTAYGAGANSYLEKPVAFDGLIELVDRLHLYWLKTNVTRAGAPGSGRP